MEERKPGELVEWTTRAEANETVDRAKREMQIIECLKQKPKQTARELALMMCQKGYVPYAERNFTAPRLTEMAHRGIVEAVGSKRCQWTGKNVAVYDLREV